MTDTMEMTEAIEELEIVIDGRRVRISKFDTAVIRFATYDGFRLSTEDRGIFMTGVLDGMNLGSELTDDEVSALRDLANDAEDFLIEESAGCMWVEDSCLVRRVNDLTNV